MNLLARAQLRRLRREPAQLLLSLLGVAIGVAVVVAVDLVNASSREAMEIASDELAGDATDVVVGPGDRVSVEQFLALRGAWRAGDPALADVRAMAPVVSGRAVLSAGGAGVSVRVLGIDPVTDGAVRARLFRADADAASPVEAGPGVGALLTRRGAVYVDARTLSQLGIAREDAAGAGLTVATGTQAASVTVLGALAAVDERIADGLIVADIATAQELLARRGWLDRVDLLRGDGATARSTPVLERLFPGLVLRAGPSASSAAPGVLPKALRVQPIAERTADTRALASSFQLNLAALGLLALAVGLFLVHGALRFSVLRRRREFAGLRAIGVSPAELAGLVRLEALVLGSVGALFGVGLGRVLADGLLALVSATLAGLYDQVAIAALPADPVPYLKGLAVGATGALLVALPTARQAADTPPALLALAPARPVNSVPWRGALALLALAAAALLPSLEPLLGYFGGLLAIAALLLAAALLTPTCVAVLLSLLARALRSAPILWRLMLADTTRGLGRSGIATAALLVAIATAVGMGIMVDSFRRSVEQWLTARLSAPVYVRIADGAELSPVLRALLDDRSRAWVERVTFDDRVADRPVSVSLVTQHGARASVPAGVMLRGDGSGVMVSEPLARALDVLAPGGTIRIDTGVERLSLLVDGVFREYGGGRGSVVLPAALWPRPPPGVRSLEIHGVEDVDAFVQSLTAVLPPSAELRRNSELLAFSLDIFDRTFRVSAVLQTLAALVAGIGLFGALAALALERQGQFGVLRTLGAPRALPVVASVTESVLLALVTALLALPVALLVAWLLVDVVNVRAFGWTLEFTLAPQELLQALLLAICAGAGAAVLPAISLWRTPTSTMLARARVRG